MSGPYPYGLDSITQANVLAWVAERWPHLTAPEWRAGKLAEEAGEVWGAVIKMNDGSGRKTLADVAQETAQVVICCMGLAESAGFDLAAEVAAELVRCWGGEHDERMGVQVEPLTPEPTERQCGYCNDAWTYNNPSWCPSCGQRVVPVPPQENHDG